MCSLTEASTFPRVALNETNAAADGDVVNCVKTTCARSVWRLWTEVTKRERTNVHRSDNLVISLRVRQDATELLKDHPISTLGDRQLSAYKMSYPGEPLGRRSRAPQGCTDVQSEVTPGSRASQVLRNVDSAVVSPKACRIAAKNS